MQTGAQCNLVVMFHYALLVVAWSPTAARPASSRATGTRNGEHET